LRDDRRRQIRKSHKSFFTLAKVLDRSVQVGITGEDRLDAFQHHERDPIIGRRHSQQI